MPGGALLWVALGGAALVLLSPLRREAWPRWLALLLLGYALALHATQEWQQRRLTPTAGEPRVLLEGEVVSVPANVGGEWRFDADVQWLPGHERRRARLAWRDPAVPPRVGERWRWVVRLSAVTESRNFTGIDLARAAFRDHVHLTGRILPAALNARLALANPSIDTLRARIATRIGDSVADPDAAALLTALAVGHSADVSADQWRVFNATGTTHLVAI